MALHLLEMDLPHLLEIGSTSGTISDGDTVAVLLVQLAAAAVVAAAVLVSLRLAIIYHYTVLAATM